MFIIYLSKAHKFSTLFNHRLNYCVISTPCTKTPQNTVCYVQIDFYKTCDILKTPVNNWTHIRITKGTKNELVGKNIEFHQIVALV